jgi:hypothetical protein
VFVCEEVFLIIFPVISETVSILSLSLNRDIPSAHPHGFFFPRSPFCNF